MACTHLLDTSVYCQPIKRSPLRSVERRWRALGDSVLCISIICEMEVLQGLEMKESKRLWDAYGALLEDRLPVLSVDRLVAKAYSRLAADAKASGTPRPALDLVIAATAAAHGLILATCDVKHYAGMIGLEVEDWSS